MFWENSFGYFSDFLSNRKKFFVEEFGGIHNKIGLDIFRDSAKKAIFFLLHTPFSLFPPQHKSGNGMIVNFRFRDVMISFSFAISSAGNWTKNNFNKEMPKIKFQKMLRNSNWQ